ncbi:MAG TPA: ABC transporter permease [Longimicrobiaceae bacterium]|nr:ABC transporter permease [Longimicrobiaceae bacterium]
METLLQDLRYSLRTLAKSPGFTLAAVLTLALGIGANTTLFSVVNAVLLRPPAHVADPERLVSLYTSDFSGPAFGASSYPDYLDFRAQTEVFQGAAAFAPRPVAVGLGEQVERTAAEVVSENYFRVLGVRPLLGRFFVPEEGTPGAAPAVVVSHDLWRRFLGGAPDVVGRTVRVNAQPMTVVGVAPEGFRGSLRGVSFDLWVPAAAGEAVGFGADDLEGRGNRGSFVVARLRPGVTLERAQARLDVVARGLHAAYPGTWTDLRRQGRRVTLLPERASRIMPQVRGPALGFLALLGATAGIVLLICCANVAGLLLARATGRLREVGIRLSLGASRGRLVRQMLTESALLAGLGAAAGVLGAVWATDLLATVELPLPVRLGLDLRPDGRVLAATAAVAAATGLLFGLAPALRASRPDVLGALKGHTGTGGRGRRFDLRSALVVAQVAMSLLLLVGGALFVRALQGAARMDVGFRAEGLLLAALTPPPGAEETADVARVAREVQERAAALPGVVEASWAASVPLAGVSRRGTTVQGYQPAEGEDMEFPFNVVGPRYFETMGVPVVRGRGITEQDRDGAPGVAVVNETFARRFWPGEDPLGKRVGVRGPEGPLLTVVGVAADGKYGSLTEEPRPYVYLAALQEPSRAVLHVRTSGHPLRALPALRGVVREAAPGWTLEDPRTMEEQVGAALLPQRLAGRVLGLFGGLALLLAAVGVYGVLAYAVAQRTREFGVRMALGARSGDVLRLVLGRGLVLVGLGLALGLPAAWAAARLLGGFLLGASPSDPAAFMAAPLLLGAVALLASWLPARRATRVSPMTALRSE